mgnify:FL=1
MQFFKRFYGKVTIVFLALLTLMGAIQFYVLTNATLNYAHEADQKLNLTLASDIGKVLQPFLKDSIDRENIEQSIRSLMVMNHRIEIYLLDKHGYIKGFWAEPGKKIAKYHLPLDQIKTFISGTFQLPLLGCDPKKEGSYKTFSACQISIGNDHGYLYVILGSEQYDSALNMLAESHNAKLFVQHFFLILIVTAILGFILFYRMTKRLRQMRDIVQKFEKGEFYSRVPTYSEDEFSQLGTSFNQMADTIEENIEALKRTDMLRRELIANVSHDLRSPIASIRGYLETILMKHKTLSETEREMCLSIALKNSDRLNHLIDELFQLSKLDAKEVQPNIEPFIINELVHDVVMKYKAKAEEKQMLLHADYTEKLPMVNADIALIDRVLSNLIENALNYSPEHTSIQIRMYRKGNDVCIDVSDKGIGIPKEDIPYIFDRFYRVEKSRSKHNGGTGLGLAISKKILDLHHSIITCVSDPHRGTTFSFNLPASKHITQL